MNWLYPLLKRIIDKIKKEIATSNAKRNLTSGNSIFYAESRIYNFQKKKQKIIIGDNSHIRGELLIQAYGGEITIGNNCFIGEYSKIWSGNKIKIGNNVLISHNVNIIDTNSHELDPLIRAESFKSLIKNGHPSTNKNIITKPIIIEDDVWINFNVIIAKGVKIGKGAIIASGAIVTKDVKPMTLVGGVPAKILKLLDN